MNNITYSAMINNNNLSYIGSVPWIIINCLLMLTIISGNLLIICAIITSRQLTLMISNQFIFSLAISDFFVGLTIPYHMCFYLIRNFGQTQYMCIMRFVFIFFSLSCSINNLFLIGLDRYIAVLYPLRYNVCMTRKLSQIIIIICWLFTFGSTSVPIYWNNYQQTRVCGIYILPDTYTNFYLTPIFLTIWLTLIFFYLKIWKEATKHAKRIRTHINFLDNYNCISDTKSQQVVMLTLGCFSICWIPYFIVTTYFRLNSIRTESNLIYEISFTMAVANSGMNPIIYAWKNSNFRMAFLCLLKCQSPNNVLKKNTSYITNHIPIIKNNNNPNINKCEIIHIRQNTDETEFNKQ